jgi:2-phospho-L-lactate/phosphoenolpyruvate guanylyltransferase
MPTAAILPVKRFSRAKQRLSAGVAPELRAELARAMVADVLDALARTPSIDSVIVVSGERSLAQAAADRGAIVVVDDLESGQSAAVTSGLDAARAAGAERVLCVPGDCPGIDAAEVEALLRARPHAKREVVVIPDRHGTGTNGLLLTPPDVITPSFGAGSCERHLALARAAGVAARLAHPRSLLLDVDTGADLEALCALAGVGPGAATAGGGRAKIGARTLAVLERAVAQPAPLAGSA